MIESLLSHQVKSSFDFENRQWVKVGPSSGSQLQAAAVTVDGVPYIFGGRNFSNGYSFNAAKKYVNGEFIPIANLPVGLMEPGYVAVGRKIYLIGGTTRLVSGYESRKVYIYDVDTDSYSTGADCPTASLVGCATAVGTDIYLYGGLVDQNESNNQKIFYKYDTVADQWTVLPYHDSYGYYSTFICSLGNRLFTFGGESSNAGIKDGTLRVYDTFDQTWSTPVIEGSKPIARAGHGVKISETQFLILGGRTSGFHGYSSECWLFDRRTMGWTKLANYPGGIGFQNMAAFNGRVLCFDGYNGSVVPGTYELI